MLHWMAVDADSDREIVEEDQLVTRQRTRLVRYVPRGCEWQTIANRSHCHPRRPATIRLPCGKRSGARQLQRIGALQFRSLHYIVDRREPIPAAGYLECLERFLAESANVPPADAKCRTIGI